MTTMCGGVSAWAAARKSNRPPGGKNEGEEETPSELLVVVQIHSVAAGLDWA
jgi:hypothetical protein